MNKKFLFSQLPTSVLKKYFSMRSFSKEVTTEVIDGVFMDITINADNTLWLNRMSKVNGHEPEICQWLKGNVSEKEVFYDVGSHFGYFPAFLSVLKRSINIHCFQPKIYASNFLRINRFNFKGMNQWELTEKYVSNINDSKNVTLDQYAADSKKWPTLIKIDIDGPEVLALKGCKEILEKRKTRFLLEVHPELMIRDYGHTWDDIFDIIPPNYKIMYLPNVRSFAHWSDSFESVNKDKNPYIYFCPEELMDDQFNDY